MQVTSFRAGAPARAASPFLNTRQTAYHLRLSVRCLERMRRCGQGPRFRRHGRFVFYHIDDIETWSRSTGSACRSDT